MRRRSNVKVCLFAKAPFAGAVKTRLALEIGPAAAANWYRRALGHSISVITRCGFGAVICAAPSASRFRSAYRISRIKIVDQISGDLGTRMGRASKASPGSSVIVGSDIPSLTISIVKAACRALSGFDAVFGPADDGGYYLVGLKSAGHTFRLFDGIRWSTPHALADTLANAPKHWRVAFLPALSDVDDVEALKRSLQPPANALVRMISSPGRILRAAKSAGRTASDA